MNKALPIVLAAAAALACSPALARTSVHFGFNFGVPVWGGWYAPYYYAPPVYYPPAYYPPAYYQPAYIPPVVAPPSQPALMEQPRPQQGAPVWYYCAQTKAYYPYVKQCAGEWERVPVTPPPG